MMGTEIFKIDASWAEKLTKTRVSFLMTPTVYLKARHLSLNLHNLDIFHALYNKTFDIFCKTTVKVRLIRLMAKDLSKDIKNVLIEANTRVKVSLSAICKTTQKYVEKGKRADFQGWL